MAKHLHIESPGMPEDEEVVVLDDDADPAGFDYLHGLGISRETAMAYRVGAVDAATFARLCPASGRFHAEVGAIIPTYDPRDPAAIVGLVRLTTDQRQHRFITAPSGLACTADIDTHRRIILCDNVVLTFLLHQAGAVGVALVEEPVVLAPLMPWLQGREVVIASRCAAGLSILRAALGTRGDSAQAAIVPMLPRQWTAATRRILGLPLPAAPPPIPEPTPQVLTDLHRYAEIRLSMAEGMTALRSLGLQDPDIVRAYRIGYLPVEYRAVLPPEVRAAFRSIKGNSIVIPATDAQGAVVDLLTVQVSNGFVVPSLFDAPRGMVGAILATSCDKLTVTDCVPHLGRHWSSAAPPLLVSSVDYARAIAPRLVAGGVTSVAVRTRRHAVAYADAMQIDGLTVTVADDTQRRGRRASVPTVPSQPVSPMPVAVAIPVAPAAPPSLIAAPIAVLMPASVPAPVPGAVEAPTATPAPVATLELLTHDAHAEQATFRYLGMTLAVQIPWGASTTLEVVVLSGDRRHRDRFDLGVEEQRQRYAGVAALITTVPAADIAAALALALPAVQRLAQPAVPASVAVVPEVASLSTTDRDDALALLRDEHLLDRIVGSFDAFGWVGEDDTKAVLFLSAISRLTPDPVWSALTATSASERFPGLAAIAAITPPDQLIHASRLTDHALANTDPDALRHKLLIVDDAHGITTPVGTAMKILRTQGSLTGTRVERDAVRGVMQTRFVAAHGPVAVISAAVGDLPDSLRHHLLEVPLDESPEQIQRRLVARRHRLAAPSPSDACGIARLRNAQRLLQALPVVMPDIERVALPQPVLANRLLQDALFGLIASSAILHQYQRPRIDGAVAATARDIAIASRLVGLLAAASTTGLGRPAQHVLAAMTATGHTAFTMADLAGLLPDRCRCTIRRALDELTALDFVAPSRGGRGITRTYNLVGNLVETGRLAQLAQVGFADQANVSPRISNG